MPRPSRLVDDVNRRIAQRIRQERLRAGLTQAQLGARIGVGHQQVWKYEQEDGRISAGRLAVLAAAVGAPVASFFEERAS